MKIANGMEFINDEKVIGKWEIVGWIDDPACNSTENLIAGGRGYNEIYFLPNGEPYWIFEGWTKGYLLIHHGGDAPIYTYTYETSVIDGKDYLFFHKEDSTEVFVKKDDRIYTKATLGRHDNINLPFIDDEKVKGKWKSVGYVENAEDFVPGDEETEYYLKSVDFRDDGILIQEYMDDVWHEKWTKGIAICLHRTTASPYFIQEINGVEYLFMEWRMGDYIYGGYSPDYYVFRKIV